MPERPSRYRIASAERRVDHPAQRVGQRRPPTQPARSSAPTARSPAGAAMTCTAEYTVTQADVDERSVTTTAVAAGVNALNQPVTSPSGAVTVQGAPVPAVRLQATTTATRLAPAGGKLAFRYTVSNTGDTTVHTVRIGIAIKHFGKISCPDPGARTRTVTDLHRLTHGHQGRVGRETARGGDPRRRRRSPGPHRLLSHRPHHLHPKRSDEMSARRLTRPGAG